MFLRQSTATIIQVGPFVDVTDGATPEIGITLGAADQAELTKAGATTTTDIAANTFAAITGNAGMYALTLTAGQLDTIGELVIHIGDVSVCRPVSHRFFVVDEALYDNFLSGIALPEVNAEQFNGNSVSGFLTGTANLKADIVKIDGEASAAENLSLSAQGIVAGGVIAGSTTTSVKTDLSKAVNDFYLDRTLMFITGTLAGQAATITAYNGSTKALTVSTLTSAPANGDLFVII